MTTIEMLELAGVKSVHARFVERQQTEMDTAFRKEFGRFLEGQHFRTENGRRAASVLLERNFRDFTNSANEHMQKRLTWDDAALKLYAPLCNATLSKDEIQATANFYRTEAGKKLSKYAPLQMREFEWKFEEAYSGDLRAFFRDEFRKRRKDALEKMKAYCGQDC